MAGVFALPFSALGSACPFKSVSGSLAQEMNYYLSEGEEKKRKGGARDWQRKSILSKDHTESIAGLRNGSRLVGNTLK